LTQEKSTEKAEISVPHLGNIERGLTKLGLPTLVKLANVLQVSVDFLVCYEIDNSVSNEHKTQGDGSAIPLCSLF
jgi:transcriptional regulator with XRE-family HTH domain